MDAEDHPYPAVVSTEDQLEDLLSIPTAQVLETLADLDSDLLVLGAGGKMGPSLAHMAARALKEIGSPYRVIAVARFTQAGLRERLESWDVATVVCDLLDRTAVEALPETRNIIFMAGQKFGTTDTPDITWAMNGVVPVLVANRFRGVRLVAFSTGNVYPLTPVTHGGADESQAVEPVGEYANSCLGRERVFEFFSRRHGTKCAIMRLNYAIELRYGILLDIARAVQTGSAIDLSMGAVNGIWQGDANAQALGLLSHATTPPFMLNVTGPEIASVRWIAHRFGDLLGSEPVFSGEEAPTALLSNAARAHRLFGYPTVSLLQLIEWTAIWVSEQGPVLDKPTGFQKRDGRF